MVRRENRKSTFNNLPSSNSLKKATTLPNDLQAVGHASKARFLNKEGKD
jgi:hypothetical protein